MPSFIRKTLFLLILSLISFAAASGQETVRNVLHQALQAQGGEQKIRALRNVEWTLAGYRDEVEESERPEGPYVTEFDDTTEIHDFQNGRFRSLTEASVYPVFKFVRGSIVTKDIAVRIANGKQIAGTPEQLRIAHERLALSPERILLTALKAPDVHLEEDTVLQSVPQNVVSFSLDGAPVRIFLNVYTHLPTAVDYSGPMAHSGFWAFLGDVTQRTWYSFWWLAKGGIHLPMQWNIEGDGLRDQMLVVKKLRLDAALKEEDFSVAQEVRAQYDPLAKAVSPEDRPLGTPGQPAIEFSPGIVFIPGAWNVTLVRQEDGIVILEAPISSGYSSKVIAEVHRRFPGLPIKAVITTSDAWPHLSGIRQYVAEEVPIYALDLNKPILSRIIDSPHTSKPDDLQRSSRPPKFHLLHGKTQVGSGLNALEIYPIRGETSERQMMVYFPQQRIVYGSDAFQRNPDGTYNLPQTVSELSDAVSREHLEVKQYFMMHVAPSPWSDLQKVLDAAASQNSPDAKGSYIIPGLIDGFGSLRTQGFADAYLYEGVTSVYVQLSPAGEDGELKIFSAQPGPDIVRGAMIGGYSVDGTPSREHPWTSSRLNGKRLSPEQLKERIDLIASQGYRGLLIGLDVWPDQLDVIVRNAHAKGLATMGEMAFTSYPYAIRAGIDTFIRSDRYQTAVDLAQDFLAYSDDPEGPGGAPGYRGVCLADTSSASVTAFGNQLQMSHTALMPILSIEATADDLEIPNPWTHRASGFVRQSDLDDPVDPNTGEHPYLTRHTPEKQKSLRECAFHREALDGRFFKLGAHLLAASGTPAFGILPGAGLHGELQLLQRIGLSPREALAAATSNYSDVFGWQDRGILEKSRRADIVILRADPRQDIAFTEDIETVILGGVIVHRAELLNRRKNHLENP